MAEYWQDILDRAQSTLGVWTDYFEGTITLGSVARDDFADLVQLLPGVAQLRDNAVQAVDEARQQVDFAETTLRLVEVGVPGIIEGVLDADSGLLDDLDKVYAVRPNTPANILKRGQLLLPVWASANTWQLGRTPPRPVIVRGTMTQALFATRLADFPGLTQAEKNAEQELTEKRGDLRRAAVTVDRLDKRFLIAARGMTDRGTAAWDALDTIPTEGASPLPETLSIRTFGQGGAGGLQLLTTYDPYDDDSATAKVLQWMIEGVDVGWDNEVAVDPSGNALGPFVVGQTIRVRTKVTNPSGSRESGPRKLTILAPPT